MEEKSLIEEFRFGWDVKLELGWAEPLPPEGYELDSLALVAGERSVRLRGASPDLRASVNYLKDRANLLGFHNIYLTKKKIGRVKAISKLGLPPEDFKFIRNEAAVLRRLHYPGIIRLHEICETKNSIYIVMELISGGLLSHAIKKNTFLDWEIRSLLQRILETLAYLHDHGIAHRDIKPENLMFRSLSSLDIVLVDFGMATHVPSETDFECCGTPGYVAPEMFNHEPYSTRCDVFSLGATMYYLTTKKTLLNCGAFSALDEGLQDLLGRMLERDPSKRISPKEALEHPFMTQHFRRGTQLRKEGSASSLHVEEQPQKKKASVFLNASLALIRAHHRLAAPASLQVLLLKRSAAGTFSSVPALSSTDLDDLARFGQAYAAELLRG
ncbi:uncharacterized protein LOC127594996 [Hippocampus zosterae]|uniref:uncharacterized protein LOC127594996 n=1 Tax=Hippocampus zosterae TaxID=109293 RepID=UPI00223E1D49|nr:uncharacterized protein LOC127594996 [Hippocampus zosterae]